VRFSQLLSADFIVALETQFFLNNLRNWWSIDPPSHVKFLWLFGGSEVCLPDSATATQLCRRFHQYALCVCRCPDACRLFRTSPAACFSSSLCSETLLLTAKRCNRYILGDFWLKFCLLYLAASKLPRLLDTLSKFALFSVCDFKDEKLIKKQTYMKTETCKLYSRDFWIFLPNIIKIDPYNIELYRFKVEPFFETQCS